jgi:hypothetical protein
MKRNKQKAIVKEQKKAAKKELTHQIEAAIGTVIVNFSLSSKKIDKVIAKTAKQLAKRISKEKMPTHVITEAPVLVVEKSEKESKKD